MLGSLKSKAADTAKRAGLLTGGLLATAVGVAFLTAAAWIYLASVADALTAALVIGAAFVGLGLVLVGVASSGKSHASAHEQQTQFAQTNQHHAEQPPLMQAFLHGMQAGVSATQNRH